VGPIIGHWPGAVNKLLANHVVLFELQLPVQQTVENQRSRWLVIVTKCSNELTDSAKIELDKYKGAI